MRDIKFRVWDKNREKIGKLKGVYSPSNEEDSRERIIISFQDFIQEKILRRDRIVFMQYTGLKDEGGTEIYEGDIVKHEGEEFQIVSEIGSFMMAKRSDETCMYEHFRSCWNDNVYPLSQHYFEHDNYDEVIDGLEVIGNIYENLELLKLDIEKECV